MTSGAGPRVVTDVVEDGLTLAAVEALHYPAPHDGEPVCDCYWGSHGCDRAAGHDLPHVCGTPPGHPFDPDEGVCSIHDGYGTRYVISGPDGEPVVDTTRYSSTLFRV